jgi:hypothetical protein
MRWSLQAACVVGALSFTPAFAQDVTLLQKFNDWTAYAAAGSPKVCFIVTQPKAMNPKKVKRGPVYFYISRWPGDGVVNEISIKMGYPFADGAKMTVNVGGTKFELFTKDEGGFVEKTVDEGKLVDAMKTGSSMKVEGKSARGTATSDTYSLTGISDALERIAKECSG